MCSLTTMKKKNRPPKDPHKLNNSVHPWSSQEANSIFSTLQSVAHAQLGTKMVVAVLGRKIYRIVCSAYCPGTSSATEY